MTTATKLLELFTAKRGLTAARLAVSAALLVLSAFLGGEAAPGWFCTSVMVLAYLIAGIDVLWGAVLNTLRLNVPEDLLLISVASVCAMATGEHMMAALMMLIFGVGRLASLCLRDKAVKDLGSVSAEIPEQARIWKYGEVSTMLVKNIQPGEVIIVPQGGVVAVDARLENSSGMFRLPDFAGSGVPTRFSAGDVLPSGSVNTGREARLTVLRSLKDSTAARVERVINSAHQFRSEPEYGAESFVRVFSTLIILLSLVIAVLPVAVFHNNSIVWIHRALVVLIAACPGAVTFAVPLAFYIGVRRSAAKGVIFTGNAALNNLGAAETFIFDKTGTLTAGDFRVTDIRPERISREELLMVAVHAAHGSDTAEARALRSCYGGRIWQESIGSRELLDDMGVRVFLDGREVCVGSAALMKRLGVEVSASENAAADIFVTICGSYAGCISLSDPARNGAAAALRRLNDAGVRKTVLMTGDREASVKDLARELGITELCTGLVPHERLEYMAELIKKSPKNSLVAFVGSRNSSSVLMARADVAITVGGIENVTADEPTPRVCTADGELSRLVEAKLIAAKTHRIARYSIFLAVIVKILVLTGAVTGLCPLWAAVGAEALLLVCCTAAAVGKTG